MSCAPAGTATKLPEGWDGTKDQHSTQDLQQNLPWVGSNLPDQEQGLAFHPAEFWGGMVAQEMRGEMFISQGKSAASDSLCLFSIIDLVHEELWHHSMQRLTLPRNLSFKKASIGPLKYPGHCERWETEMLSWFRGECSNGSCSSSLRDWQIHQLILQTRSPVLGKLGVSWIPLALVTHGFCFLWPPQLSLRRLGVNGLRDFCFCQGEPCP